MFRIGLKLPSNLQDPLYKIQKYGCTRLYSTIKWREMQLGVISTENRLTRRIRIPQEYFQAGYSSETPKSSKSSGGKGLLFLGSITLGTIGILTLVKNNPGMRSTIEEWVPGTDNAIKIIFQEENAYLDYVLEYFENLKQSILGLFGEEKQAESIAKLPPVTEITKTQISSNKKDPVQLKPKDSTPPKPELTPVVEHLKPPQKEPPTVPLERKEKIEEIKIVTKEPTASAKVTTEAPKPANFAELESSFGLTGTKAIEAYKEAIEAVKKYNQEVEKLIADKEAYANVGSLAWRSIKEATEQRKRAVRQAEENAVHALQLSTQLLRNMDKDEHKKVDKILNDIKSIKTKYEDEVHSVNLSENFWNKVKSARENFHDELLILFPNIKLDAKNLSVNEEAFDLFVLHMYNKVMRLQTDMAKLETVGNASLKAALKSTGDLGSEEKINELIRREVQKEKRLLQDEFEKMVLVERKAFEDELMKQLKLQARMNADITKEALEIKEQEMKLLMNRTLRDKFEVEINKLKAQLALINNRMSEIIDAVNEQLRLEKDARKAQIFWSACQALAKAVKVAPLGTSSDSPMRPLEAEIKAVSKVAPKEEDVLVQVTLAAIPKEALKRGVYPENILRERFLKVEHMARRLALVPAEGASLPIYFLSYLQNFLLIKPTHGISKKELSDEAIDVNKLDTFDILNRARFWLDRGDFKMTLRYMNLLKGASRIVAQDWMNETRILLETQLTIDTLLAYAREIGLVFSAYNEKKSAQN